MDITLSIPIPEKVLAETAKIERGSRKGPGGTSVATNEVMNNSNLDTKLLVKWAKLLVKWGIIREVDGDDDDLELTHFGETLLISTEVKEMRLVVETNNIMLSTKLGLNDKEIKELEKLGLKDKIIESLMELIKE